MTDLGVYNYLESLRLLSLQDNKYLRYFKGHHDRYCKEKKLQVSVCLSKEAPEITNIYVFFCIGWYVYHCVQEKIPSFQDLLIKLSYCGMQGLIKLRY